MPHTINGIGTHYWGKRNRLERPGVCPHCGKSVQLTSYDTRLWFVVLFLPLVPLGRKRVVDYCPRCTLHGVVKLGDWEQRKGEAVERGMAAMRERPGESEPALELFGSLLAFGEIQPALELSQAMSERFAADAGVLARLGATLEVYGRGTEARRLLDRAFEIDPAQPTARVARALELVRIGSLDEARELLKFLEDEGSPADVRPLWPLADALSRAGRGAEASALFDLLARRAPELAQLPEFRRDARRAARAPKGQRVRLPRRRGSWKIAAAATAGVAVLALLAFAGLVEPARHRTLWVAHGFEEPVVVDVRGSERFSVPAGHVRAVELSEGDWTVELSGPVERTLIVPIHTGLRERLFDHPAFVLNVEGSAIFMLEHLIYSASPDPSAPFRGELLYGEELVKLPDVDFAFTAAPEQIRIESSGDHARRTALDLFRGGIHDAFAWTWSNRDPSSALLLAEWHLRLHPGDVAFLSHYLQLASDPALFERVRAFLATGAGLDPVRIPWHRAHQHFELLAGEDPTPRYEALLSEQPLSSELCYLRGRICARRSEAEALYLRALQADDGNAYAQAALGHLLGARGEWAAARERLERAIALEPAEPAFAFALRSARLQLGDHAAMERELEAELSARPDDLHALMALGEVLLSRGAHEQARALQERGEAAYRATYGAEAGPGIDSLRNGLDYFAGDPASCAARLGQDAAAKESGALQRVLLEQGSLDQARQAPAGKAVGDEAPIVHLAWALAAVLAGDEESARGSRQAAQAALEAGPAPSRLAAELVTRGPDVPLSELLDAYLDPRLLAVLLAELSLRWPERGEELAAAARASNVERSFPYLLVERATPDSLPQQR